MNICRKYTGEKITGIYIVKNIFVSISFLKNSVFSDLFLKLLITMNVSIIPSETGARHVGMITHWILSYERSGSQS